MRLFHSIVASAVLAFLLLNVPLVNSKDLNNHNFQLDSSPDINNHFEIDTKALCNVAENSLTYLNQNNSDTFAVHAGKVFNQNLTLNKVKETLTFICKVEAEDKRLNQPSRLKQKDFLQKNFNFYRWTPDKKTANNLADKSTNTVKTRLLRNIPNDEILLTKYYTKLLNGSELKTDKFSQALYALPYDERALTLEEANDKKSNLTRYKYTRQEIINGALLNKKLALPLIWLMMLPMLYLWARMTLILPSAAISQQPSVTLSGSMALTKGNGWRMVAVTVAPLLAFGMLDILIQMSLPAVVYWWLQPLIVSVNTVLGVVLVSVSFKQLYDERQLNAESDENGVVAA